MQIYSHRGIGLGKENSLASIKRAKQLGIKYEADVRKSKDGELVLWHDRGLVEKEGYSELKKRGIVRLEDALQIGIELDLDIKEGVKGSDVLALVEQHDMVKHVIFTSFYPWKVMNIKRRNNEAKVGFLSQMKLPQIVLPIMAKVGMDYVLPHTETITQQWVQSAHRSGLKVITWCGSEEEIKQSNRSDGVDGMILNNAKPIVA